ncbi:malonic semialdehyde reductase [Actinoalloteichus sp. AHMU CJ021]|uniref:3-hydroxypropanoate dehydrogenase n=1 Tax=Actinoalloteichus caeruleus DSM 43889 TaxID=1120930 RepID=A0ABT1JN54_ACTCY|nr:malonic semialdehyde reductase [Actinoalloteichus caeruleus]AUS79802.1 malonic semialdehyde reductase [Actinoalloteichus sp. AHMU CJ021]MCP2333957.1 3-hydroxypropanoate dehydrogenase [Actinoalloteichus caeruleus DSM 43889]
MTSTTTPHITISPESQEQLFREARTANTFTDEPVTDEQVRAIYDLVKWAPTSMNQQPLRATLVRSPEARERLVGHMADGNKEKTGNAPLAVILTADTDFHEHLPSQFPPVPNAKDFFAEATGRESSARLNATLQVGYFILGVRAAGLAAGPMTGFDAAGIEADFFPEGNQRVLAVVNVGRPGPDAWYPRLPRLEYDQVVSSV